MKIALFLILTASLLTSCGKGSSKPEFKSLSKAEKLAHCKKEIHKYVTNHGIDEADLKEVKIYLSKDYFDGKSDVLAAKVDLAAFESDYPVIYLKAEGKQAYFFFKEKPGELKDLTYIAIDKL